MSLTYNFMIVFLKRGTTRTHTYTHTRLARERVDENRSLSQRVLSKF